jgi:hypothetical protein
MLTQAFKVLAGICAALVISGANADTITYSFPINLEPTEINQTGSLALFDTNLGTLTAASLTIDANLQSDISLTNNSTQTQNFTLTTDMGVGISSTLPAVHQLFNHSSDLALDFTTGVVRLAPDEVVSASLLDNKNLAIDLSPALAELSASGGGSFNISCESFTSNSQSGGGGNVNVDQITNAGCGAMVIYTYTPTTTRRFQPQVQQSQ